MSGDELMVSFDDDFRRQLRDLFVWRRDVRRFRSDSLPSKEYLHEMLLAELSRDLGLRWTIHQPWYGWKWHMRPWRARLRGQRPPSRFCILVAQPQSL